MIIAPGLLLLRLLDIPARARRRRRRGGRRLAKGEKKRKGVRKIGSWELRKGIKGRRGGWEGGGDVTRPRFLRLRGRRKRWAAVSSGEGVGVFGYLLCIDERLCVSSSAGNRWGLTIIVAVVMSFGDVFIAAAAAAVPT